MKVNFKMGKGMVMVNNYIMMVVNIQANIWKGNDMDKGIILNKPVKDILANGSMIVRLVLVKNISLINLITKVIQCKEKGMVKEFINTRMVVDMMDTGSMELWKVMDLCNMLMVKIMKAILNKVKEMAKV